MQPEGVKTHPEAQETLSIEDFMKAVEALKKADMKLRKNRKSRKSSNDGLLYLPYSDSSSTSCDGGSSSGSDGCGY